MLPASRHCAPYAWPTNLVNFSGSFGCQPIAAFSRRGGRRLVGWSAEQLASHHLAHFDPCKPSRFVYICQPCVVACRGRRRG